MEVRIFKAMHKTELAEIIDVSVTTLRKWLRKYDADLKKMGVSKNAKILPPCAVKFVCEKYSIDLYEDELNGKKGKKEK